MKYKVGDKVRVRSDLVVDEYYGNDVFVEGMEHLKGEQATIRAIVGDCYSIKEDNAEFFWTDEMLEPLETFNVGDVVVTDRDDKVTLLELAWRVKFENGRVGFRRFHQLSKEKPLQKITRKELAEKGYELVD